MLLNESVNNRGEMIVKFKYPNIFLINKLINKCFFKNFLERDKITVITKP